MKLTVLAALSLALLPQAQVAVPDATHAQAGSPGAVSFDFAWALSDVPHWFIELDEDGTGHYDVLQPDAPPAATSREPITVSRPVLERLRAPYPVVVSGNCETKAKHLAQTGTKRLAYATTGSDAWTSCSFNYSDDKSVMAAVAIFQAIAETMQAGTRLTHDHRYDRLGLDAELDFLTNEAAAGRAIEFQNIAPVLRAIADDEHVIDRARRKAARLVQDVPSPGVSPR